MKMSTVPTIKIERKIQIKISLVFDINVLVNYITLHLFSLRSIVNNTSFDFYKRVMDWRTN